jgi:ABC-type phosphate transport system substrate-binding protein
MEMPSLRQRIARVGATAGVLAVSTAAFLAVGGAGASVASAACLTPTSEGLTIAGSGSSLQKVAQENWTAKQHALCPSQTVNYTSTSSGKGLTALGFQPGSTIDHTQAFIGTDDGPNKTQIEHAEAQSGTKPLIIPVAETAIAVVGNPPGTNAECHLATGTAHGLGYVQLTQIFGGKEVTNWSELATAGVVEGSGCTGEITRVVRAEGSGTTYQFKNYLATLQASLGGKEMPCGLPGAEENASGEVIAEPTSTKAWKNMRHVGAKNTNNEEPPNTTWPQPVSGKVGFCAGTTPVSKQEGGGAVAAFVAANNGTIGYAALPDAKAKSAEVMQLQDQSSPVRYAGPVKGTTTESNCGSRIYTVPTPGREGETGEAVNWSQVFGASPTIGNTEYPLCTLTYDVAWKSYATAGYGATEGPKIAKNVKNYDEFLIGTEGAKILKEHYYQELPKGTGSTNNVFAAATLSISKIG